ncbi:MAG TPA: hypothetical protein VEK82_16210 [Stellaceae bacterium]|nr:hypothetical protein [Stellaceae bacterium]
MMRAADAGPAIRINVTAKAKNRARQRMRHISSFKHKNRAVKLIATARQRPAIISVCGAIILRANGDVLDLLILYGNPRAAPWQFRGALSPPIYGRIPAHWFAYRRRPLIAINFPRPNHSHVRRSK